MPTDHKEKAFEAAIEHHLAVHGAYTHGDNRDYDALGSDPTKSPLGYDREAAIFPGVFIAFVKATQPDTYQALAKLHGTGVDAVIIDDLRKALDGQPTRMNRLRDSDGYSRQLFHSRYEEKGYS